MTTRRVEFTGAGGRTVTGHLESPVDGAPRACAIFAHCFSCSSNHRAAVYMSRALAERQMAVLRFDFAGAGEGAVETVDSILARNADDIVAAARFLEEEASAPALLVGHSLGGVAAILAAPRIPTVSAVTTIGAPARVGAISGILPTEPDGEGGRAGSMTQDRLLQNVRELRTALLIMHATNDEVVALDDAALLYTAARHPKSFVALPDAGHLLLERSDSDYAAGVLAAWVERYMAPLKHPSEGGAERPTGVTVATGREGYRTEIGVRAHTLLADEPVAVGGSDSGPTPYDLLVAALGACTTMTLQMYARRKGWPLDRAVARLRHSRVYSTDQTDCPDRPARLDRVERELELEGELDDEQRARLLEIADRCPVHRTLESGLHIVTALSPPGTDAR